MTQPDQQTVANVDGPVTGEVTDASAEALETSGGAATPSADAPAEAAVAAPDHSDLPDVPEATTVTVDGPNGTSTSRSSSVSIEDVTEAMKDVVDPELGINVVDLGLVYGVHLDEESNAVLDMTLTSAACPLTDVIQDQTNSALEGLVNDVAINWVWMPPWGPDKITDDGRDQLRALGFNV